MAILKILKGSPKKRESLNMKKIREFKELLESKIARWEKINEKHQDLEKAKKSSSNIYKKIHSENKRFCSSVCKSVLKIGEKDAKKFPKFAEEIKYRVGELIRDLEAAFLEVDEKHDYKKALKKMKSALSRFEKYEKLINLLKEKNETK